MKEKGSRTAYRFDLNPASRLEVGQVQARGIPAYELVSLPLYVAAILQEVIDLERQRQAP